MRQISRTTYKGFTLLEVSVSLFIFTIVMASVAQIFSAAFSGFRVTRNVEHDIENAQYAINILAKELRTSSVVSVSGNRSDIQFYDHSQSICFRYRIHREALQVASIGSTGVDSGVKPCNTIRFNRFNSFSEASTGTVTGLFRVTPSTRTGGRPNEIGRVTIALEVTESATHKARIQTTVSLRDFGNIGL